MKSKLLLLILLIIVGGCSNSSNEKEEETKKEEVINVSVKDLSGPVIQVDKDKFELTIGDNFKLENHIIVMDNADGKLNYEIKGSYDISKVGDYEVTIHAKDSAGNASNKKVAVIVKEKEKELKEEVDTNKGITNSSNASQSGGSSSKQQPSRSEQPSNKQFLLSNGYTMSGGANPADNACALYIANNVTPGWLGQCSTIVDGNGMPIGSETVWSPY